MVEVRSAVGAVRLPLEVTPDVFAGVVSIPHGWGHDRPGTRLRTASANPGVSINDLTDSSGVDPISGNAAFCGVPVCVTACTSSSTTTTNGERTSHEKPGAGPVVMINLLRFRERTESGEPGKDVYDRYARAAFQEIGKDRLDAPEEMVLIATTPGD